MLNASIKIVISVTVELRKPQRILRGKYAEKIATESCLW